MANQFGRNLKALREAKGYTQEGLAFAIGSSPITISKWETTDRQPRRGQFLDAICNVLGCSENDLFGYTDGFYSTAYGLRPKSSTDTYAPVLGNISAGVPKEAIELSDESHWVPPDVLERHPDGFFLKISGDSMDRVIPDGSYCFIAPCEVNSGDIAAVKVNGDDATIKRVNIRDGIIILEPDSSNPSYRRRIIDETDPDAPEVRILGKVVWMDFCFA